MGDPSIDLKKALEDSSLVFSSPLKLSTHPLTCIKILLKYLQTQSKGHLY